MNDATKAVQRALGVSEADNVDKSAAALASRASKEEVNHPAHYGGDTTYEVIKVLENWLTTDEFVGFLKGNVIKYQARARAKGGAKDYEKAAWYNNYLTDYMKRINT